MQVNASISLIEDGKMVNQDSQIAEIFNQYFANITHSLGITVNDSLLLPTSDILDSIDKSVKKYEARPSICKIKNTVKFSDKFEFRKVTIEELAIKIRQLNPRKASPADWIPAKILMENSDVFSVAKQNLFNSCLLKGTFPTELKAGDISSLFKEEDASMKKNYRPITVLPLVSKIYERLVQANATFHPKFPVSNPLWISKGLWYAACIATFCGSLQEDNGQQGRRRGCLDRPFKGL